MSEAIKSGQCKSCGVVNEELLQFHPCRHSVVCFTCFVRDWKPDTKYCCPLCYDEYEVAIPKSIEAEKPVEAATS